MNRNRLPLTGVTILRECQQIDVIFWYQLELSKFIQGGTNTKNQQMQQTKAVEKIKKKTS